MQVLSVKPALVLAYFAYFGVLGIFIPYLGLFLDGRGLNSAEIGLLLSVLASARIFGPTIWALLAERQQQPLVVMRMGALLAGVGWVACFADLGFWWLLAGFSFFSFFWTAVLPQLEVSAFHFLNDNTQQYGRIRTAGSLGYIVLVMLGGWLFEIFGSEFLPAATIIFLLLLLFSLCRLPDFHLHKDHSVVTQGFGQLLRQSIFWRFMGAACLMQIGFAPFYGFFTLYCRDLGYSGYQTGFFIGLAVFAEIMAFYFGGALVKKFSYRLLLGICYGLSVIRWLMLAWYADTAWWLGFSMLFHAASFAIAHSSAMQFIHSYFPKHLRNRGQALYAGIIFGGGGAIGAYLAGILWQNGAGAGQTFVVAAVFAFLAMCLALTLPPKAAISHPAVTMTQSREQ